MRKKKAVHARPKPKKAVPEIRKRKHRHRWQETARYAFNDGGVARYNVYYKCRSCPMAKAEVEPKRHPGRPWWRR